MRASKFFGRAAAYFATTAAMLLSLSACGSHPDVAQWTEEVQLHDGRVITLERRSMRGSAGVLMDHRPLVTSWELCYRPSNAYWKSNSPFQPSHFEIADGKAYVKVPLGGCDMCEAMSYPETSTLYFVLSSGQWQRISAKQFPDRRWRNLMMNRIWDARDKEGDIHGHWNTTEKRKRDDITEESITGKRIMKDQLSACLQCNYKITTNTKLVIESQPVDEFCK